MEDNIKKQTEDVVYENENVNNLETKEVSQEKSSDEIIEELEKEIANWKKEYAIKLTDFQNYAKRKDKEFMEYKKYACESLVKKQIESLDVLKMAVESAKSNHDIDNLIEGLEMIQKTMISYLKDEGLEEIKAEGEEYDPYIHQAVSTVSEDKFDDNKVVSVLQKGYRLKGKVIRPAMVTINKK